MNVKKIIIIVIICIIAIVLTILYSRFIATTGLKIKEYKIEDKIFKDNFHGLKIVHISDIHYLRTVKKKELSNLVLKVNELNPDVVVITGDLIDKDKLLNEKTKNTLIEELSKINSSLGKYAVSGNHDVVHKEWADIINNSGFINLNESYDTIYNTNNDIIFIGGISSSKIDKKEKFDEKINSVIKNLDDVINNNQDKNIYKILLIHEPDSIRNFEYSKFNLILAGHSHNGQVNIPLIKNIFLPKGARKYYKESYTLGDTKLFISSGVGTSNVDFRLFNRPSINFYRLTNK